MEKWQYNILFFVGVSGIILLIIAPAIPPLAPIGNNPQGVTALGLLLAYLFTQKSSLVKDHKKDKDKPGDEEDKS
jgi:hypothetical protein